MTFLSYINCRISTMYGFGDVAVAAMASNLLKLPAPAF